MDVLIIILLLIGIGCIVASLLLKAEASEVNSQQASSVVITDKYELTEDEEAIVKEKVQAAVGKYTNTYINDFIETTNQSLSTLSNEKILALGDYAVTVCDEIEKNHKEVIFLYDRLQEKESELKELLLQAERTLIQIEQQEQMLPDDYVEQEIEELRQEETNTEETSINSVLENETDESDNANEIILQMYKNGMKIMDIAKELGLGIGEVKLVVDLYKGE